MNSRSVCIYGLTLFVKETPTYCRSKVKNATEMLETRENFNDLDETVGGIAMDKIFKYIKALATLLSSKRRYNLSLRLV